MFKVPSTVLNISYLLFQQKLTLKTPLISTLTIPILQMRELEHGKRQSNLPKGKLKKIFESKI